MWWYAHCFGSTARLSSTRIKLLDTYLHIPGDVEESLRVQVGRRVECVVPSLIGEGTSVEAVVQEIIERHQFCRRKVSFRRTSTHNGMSGRERSATSTYPFTQPRLTKRTTLEVDETYCTLADRRDFAATERAFARAFQQRSGSNDNTRSSS